MKSKGNFTFYLLAKPNVRYNCLCKTIEVIFQKKAILFGKKEQQLKCANYTKHNRTISNLIKLIILIVYYNFITNKVLLYLLVIYLNLFLFSIYIIIYNIGLFVIQKKRCFFKYDSNSLILFLFTKLPFYISLEKLKNKNI